MYSEQWHRTAVEVLHVAAAFDAEHLVRLADVDDQLRGHEIGPESDLRGLVAVLEEQVLQQRGVEHDVAMVRDEKVTLRGVEPLDSLPGERGDAAGDDLLVHHGHDLFLKLTDRLDGRHFAAHGLKFFLRKDIGGQQRKELARCDALHRRRDLLVAVGTDVVEFGVVHGYLRLS